MNSNISVTHHKDRYVITVDGEQAGFTIAIDHGDDDRIFPHTEVSDAFSGQGLAGKLVEYAVNDSVASGKTIIPVCPYVAKWLGKHPEFEEHRAKPRPEHLAVLKSGQD